MSDKNDSRERNLDKETVDRRQFISAATAMAMLGGAGIVIGCGGGNNGVTPQPVPPPPPPPAGNQVGVVGDNHGHVATVIGASVDPATGVLRLNIMGSANHPHTVDLSAAQLESIRSGTKVSVTSTNDDGYLPDGTPVPHTHMVVFN